MNDRRKLFRLAWSFARSWALFHKTGPREHFPAALRHAWKETKKRAAIEAMYAAQTPEKIADDRAALLAARAAADAADRARDPKPGNGMSPAMNAAAARRERKFGCAQYGGGAGSMKYTACH